MQVDEIWVLSLVGCARSRKQTSGFRQKANHRADSPILGVDRLDTRQVLIADNNCEIGRKIH